MNCQFYRQTATLLRKSVLGFLLVTSSVSTQAAFLLEIDTDGQDDGVLTYNPLFAFGGDTTTASHSLTSPAYGTTAADSIYGGDGVNLPDTYVYTYTPASNADNLAVPVSTDLGEGSFANGQTGGAAGSYRVYATWPFTTNVTGGNTSYTISTAGTSDVVVQLDQNGGGAGRGGEWILLGSIPVADPSQPITVTQDATVGNTFISMRAYGLLFEIGEEGPPPSEPIPSSARPVPTMSAAIIVLLGLFLTAVVWRSRQLN